jgi:hypothetical protein
MAASSLSKEMLRYFTQLNTAEQLSIFQMIKTLSMSRRDDFKPQTLEEYNRELEEADRRIEAGHFITQEDLEKEMKTW